MLEEKAPCDRLGFLSLSGYVRETVGKNIQFLGLGTVMK